MDFLQLAKERHSVRQYASTPVEEEKLQRILEAGRVAPTAANYQPQRFLVVRTTQELAKLGKTANIHGAPLAVLVCGLKDRAWKRPQDGHSMLEIDASIAATHMVLQACSEGIGSCWITWFHPAMLRHEFALPENVIPVHILVFGYAATCALSPERHSKQRIPLEQMVWSEACCHSK